MSLHKDAPMLRDVSPVSYYGCASELLTSTSSATTRLVTLLRQPFPLILREQASVAFELTKRRSSLHAVAALSEVFRKHRRNLRAVEQAVPTLLALHDTATHVPDVLRDRLLGAVRDWWYWRILSVTTLVRCPVLDVCQYCSQVP